METKQVFTIHKGMDRPVEFKGLQGRYLIGLVGIAVSVLVAFGILHVIAVNSWLSILLALGGGGLGIMRLYRLNKIHGQYGRMKRSAQRALPGSLVSYSRKAFIQLYSDGTGSVRGAAAHFGSGIGRDRK